MNAVYSSLYELAGPWLAAMGRASLYGGIVLALVWVACRCFPRLPARWRCWLWRLALLKLVLCVTVANTLNLALLPSSFSGGSPERVENDPADPRFVGALVPGAVTPTSPAVPGSVASEVLDPPTVSAPDSSGPAIVSASGVAASVLFTLWVAVVLGLLCLTLARVVSARRWRRECVLIKDPEILTLGERLAKQYGLVQPPLLFSADFCHSPVVFGALRTAIVLPEAIVEKMTLAEMQLILAHEMAHIRRGDLLGNWFVSIVSGLFFFHPLVWLGFRETRLAQETACDELALGLSGGSIADYGNLIVDLATRCCRPTAAIVAVGVVESFQNSLKRRLRAMKDFGTGSFQMVVLSWFLAVVAAVGLLPWRVVAQAGPEDDLRAAETDEEAAEAIADHFQPVRAPAGKYSVTVDGVRPAHGVMTMQMTGFPMIPRHVSYNTHSQDQTKQFPGAGGGGFVGGGGSGTGVGMGGGHSSAYLKPNLILDVKVEPAKSRKGNWLLAAVNGKVRAEDEHGNELDSPGSPAMVQDRFAEMDYPEGSGRTAIHLHRPRNSGNYIKSLEGELLVIETQRREFVFKGKDLSRKTKRRNGDVTVALHKVKQAPEGIDVAVAVPPAFLKKPRDMDVFERMQRLHTLRNRVHLTLEDTQGRTYQPTSTESSSSASRGSNWRSGGGSGGTSWSSSGGSISGSGGSSWGPGGSGRKSWGSGGQSGRPTVTVTRSIGDGQDRHEGQGDGATLKVHFDPLPEGAKLEAVHCTVTDHLGKPEAVAFRLEGIPLSGAVGK